MLKTNTALPTRKVTASVLGSAITSILVFLLNTYVFRDNPITAEVGGAITILVTALLGYFVPPGSDDGVVVVNESQRN